VGSTSETGPSNDTSHPHHVAGKRDLCVTTPKAVVAPSFGGRPAEPAGVRTAARRSRWTAGQALVACRADDVLDQPPRVARIDRSALSCVMTYWRGRRSAGRWAQVSLIWPNRDGLKWCAADRLAQAGVGVGDSGAQRTRPTSISQTEASVSCRSRRARPRLRRARRHRRAGLRPAGRSAGPRKWRVTYSRGRGQPPSRVKTRRESSEASPQATRSSAWTC